MPISRDEFEDYERDDERSNAERVLRFLAENREQAFRATEIAEATGVDSNSIHPVLTRLRERELVRHKRPYWAIGDLDRVHQAYVFHMTNVFLNEKYGPESREEWLDAAAEYDDS